MKIAEKLVHGRIVDLVIIIYGQVYATWFDYGVITSLGAKKEVLSFSGYKKFTAMLSPSLGWTYAVNGYWNSGEFNPDANGGGNAKSSFGARPALYQEGENLNKEFIMT